MSGFALATHLSPKTAARCGAVLLGSLLVAAVPTVWVIGLSGLAHVGLRSPVVDWSLHILPANEPFGTIIGVLSLLARIPAPTIGNLAVWQCQLEAWTGTTRSPANTITYTLADGTSFTEPGF